MKSGLQRHKTESKDSCLKSDVIQKRVNVHMTWGRNNEEWQDRYVKMTADYNKKIAGNLLGRMWKRGWWGEAGRKK